MKNQVNDELGKIFSSITFTYPFFLQSLDCQAYYQNTTVVQQHTSIMKSNPNSTQALVNDTNESSTHLQSAEFSFFVICSFCWFYRLIIDDFF